MWRQKIQVVQPDIIHQYYEPTFLANIQPQGGLSFTDKFIKKGDSYETCIHIWGYPTNVEAMWLKNILTMREVIAVQDVATMERDEAISAINKSMLEQKMRHSLAKNDSTEIDAQNSYSELERLYQEISQMGEVIKLMNLRLFITNTTLQELEINVQRIISELYANGFKGQVFLNEMAWEWQSLFVPYTLQQQFPNKRDGKAMTSEALAAGLPYHFAELNDPQGSYLGTSFTNGNVLFNLFHKDKKRRYYNGVVVGTMGAGKSTTLKKLAMDNACRGNYIRGFDITGEFETLVEALNGQSIRLDGSQGIINPLQIYKIEGTQDSVKSESLSFMQHLAKVATFYEFIADKPTTGELEEFKKILRTFYEKLGFRDKMRTIGVTNLMNDEYPIFSDFLVFIRQELYSKSNDRVIRSELSPTRISRLENIELVIDNLVNSYAHLFNGYTTIPDFTTEQIIFFSIRNLTRLEKSVFNAQMYNALTLIWDNLIQIGAPQMRAVYEDENFDEAEATRFLVIIDEAHRIVNAENLLAVSFLTDFAREARKYFGGLLLASQSIRDFVPDHSDTGVVTKIRTLFELTQYKFIMQQDTNTLETLRVIFEGQISDSEIAQIPQFQQGDCLLSISGANNLMFSVEASDEEINLFRGGM